MTMVASSGARRKVLITGAAQGIGARLAVDLACEGYEVAVSSRELARLEKLVAEVQRSGARIVPVALDITAQSSIEQALQEVTQSLGGLDVLVNNAGITLRKPAVDVTRDEWNSVMATDLTGTFFVTQWVGRYWIARQHKGVVINLASTHGLVGMATRAAYGIAKAGVLHMTRMLAIEWAPHGIRVNAVAPGRVDTESRADSYGNPQYIQFALSRVPLGRFAQVEDVSAAVRYLASEAASYVTGQTLVVDGGVTSQ